MNDTADAKKQKDRSPNFPFITLERAIERARLFYNEEKRGVAPYTRAVLHWGFTASSSSALQTVSALKSYGLLTEVGGTGASRQLQLSQLALRILLDQRPDSEDRQNFIREAARTPSVASDVYSKWPSLPSDATLSHYLVLERRFNESTAPAVIKILKENQDFASLSSSDLLSDEAPIGPAEDGAQAAQAQSSPPLPIPPDRQAVHSIPPSALSTPPSPSLVFPAVDAGHIEQHVLRSGMKVTVHFSAQPSADTYHALARLMKFKGDDFAAQEAPPAELPVAAA